MKSLWIIDSGADTQEIKAGIAAAMKVFDANGVNPLDAHDAQYKIDSGEAVTNQETMRAVVWGEADNAAVLACCAGWLRIPAGAHLELQ